MAVQFYVFLIKSNKWNYQVENFLDEKERISRNEGFRNILDLLPKLRLGDKF